MTSYQQFEDLHQSETGMGFSNPAYTMSNGDTAAPASQPSAPPTLSRSSSLGQAGHKYRCSAQGPALPSDMCE